LCDGSFLGKGKAKFAGELVQGSSRSLFNEDVEAKKQEWRGYQSSIISSSQPRALGRLGRRTVLRTSLELGHQRRRAG
jgi:hypothetical protein